MGPISHPHLSPGNAIFLVLLLVCPIWDSTFLSTCLNRPVLCRSTSGTMNMLLNWIWDVINRNLDLEFFCIIKLLQSFELSCLLILLLQFPSFTNLISFLAALIFFQMPYSFSNDILRASGICKTCNHMACQ